MARDIRVAFKLSEEKKHELEHYANSYGVTMSALCALIVGQWLHQQNKIVNPIVEAMSQTLQQQLMQNTESPEMEQFIKTFEGKNRP